MYMMDSYCRGSPEKNFVKLQTRQLPVTKDEMKEELKYTHMKDEYESEDDDQSDGEYNPDEEDKDDDEEVDEQDGSV
jgi:hypothetical protein